MRITNSMYYRDMYGENNKIGQALFDVNKQISSGQKIQYAHEDTATFIDTMRLDNEATTLTQIKKSTESAYKFSTQTDTVLGDFSKTLDSIKVKLVSAATNSHSHTSMNAIAQDLRGLETHLKSLANTSVNGQYLFSGTQTSTKPLDGNGNYAGNDGELHAFFGSGIKQKYNISGADLFLGDESNTGKKITSNVKQLSLTDLYPDVMQDSNTPRNAGFEKYITSENTIRDLMGDTDSIIDTTTAKHHFYIRGNAHDGSAFKETISMRDDESVSDLLTRIGEKFGNSGSHQIVNVTLNNHGQIEIEDKQNGSSKLDFHMVANTDDTGVTINVDDLNTNQTTVKSFIKSEFTQYVETISQRQSQFDTDNFKLTGDFYTKEGTPANTSTLLRDVVGADVQSIAFGGADSNGIVVNSSLNITASSTMQDLVSAIDTAYDANVSSTANGDLRFSIHDGAIAFGREKGFASSINIQLSAKDALAGAGNTIDGIPSDRSVAFDVTNFTKSGNRVSGNVAQIISANNSYATDATKLKDVADLSQGTSSTLDGTQFNLKGINIDGNAFDVQINLNSAGSTFTIGGSTYNIFSASAPRAAVDADEMTYRQLNDVINMVATNNLPASIPGTDTEYDNAIINANAKGTTELDNFGKIVFQEDGVTDTKVDFSLSDANASNFSADASVLTFQANNALTIRDPKTDFFTQLNEVISSVEEGRYRADGDNAIDPRSLGIQNGMQIVDDLNQHVGRMQTQAGSQSQSLNSVTIRTETLLMNTKTLRSEVLDTDIAEATLHLQQLQLNYQAMFSSVSRISQLSLVNYL
ncbi:MAG: flagellar hook-associated protein FlgL [Campylobacterota bacterium]|nr:flagellar hook-associated protein FlgL [Campylobacterota bacterium]